MVAALLGGDRQLRPGGVHDPEVLDHRAADGRLAQAARIEKAAADLPAGGEGGGAIGGRKAAGHVGRLLGGVRDPQAVAGQSQELQAGGAAGDYEGRHQGELGCDLAPLPPAHALQDRAPPLQLPLRTGPAPCRQGYGSASRRSIPA